MAAAEGAFAHNASGYRNHKCRCDDCRAGATERMRTRRRAAAAARRAATEAGRVYVAAGVTHGRNAYTNYGCRCQVCVDAWNGQARARRAARGAS